MQSKAAIIVAAYSGALQGFAMVGLTKIACAMAALVSSTAAMAQDSGWTISETDGQVSVIRDSEAIYGAEGTHLQIGDVVSTSEAGRAVLVRGKEFVVVAPKAQVRIKRAEKAGLVDQTLEFLSDLLLTGSEPTSGQRAVATVVKGYGNSNDNHDVLAAIDAKSGLKPDE
jgi:hypothetical protein